MTDASNDPEVFLTQVDDAFEDVEEAINSFLAASATLMESAIATAQAHASGLGGAVKGFLTGGAPGAAAGYAEGFVDELVEQLDAGANQINAEWEDAAETIRQAIGSIVGDPVKMVAIASHYRQAIDTLGQVRNDVESANSYVAESWTGRAHTAYSNTSGFQLNAMDGVIATLGDSATLLDDHAVTLVTFWTDQLQNLVDLAAAISSRIAEIGDAGNWFTAGAGVVVGLIADAASGATAIVTETAKYWADLNITKAGNWDQIQSHLGSRGLEGDQWPDFNALDAGHINQPWEATA